MRARLHTARPIDWLAFNQITQKMSRMNAFERDFRKNVSNFSLCRHVTSHVT